MKARKSDAIQTLCRGSKEKNFETCFYSRATVVDTKFRGLIILNETHYLSVSVGVFLRVTTILNAGVVLVPRFIHL